jgi:hypothetical protein
MRWESLVAAPRRSSHARGVPGYGGSP